MVRSPLNRLVLTLGALTLVACAEDRSPTEPESGAQPVSPGSLAAVLASNTWTLKAPGYTLFGISAGVMPDATGQSIVYTFGGTDGTGSSGAGVGVYKIGTNTWSSRYTPGGGVGVYNANGVGRIG